MKGETVTDSNSNEVGFDLATSPSHLLHRAQQLAIMQSASDLRAAGVTLRQFTVLACLAGEGGVSQSHLVEVTGIDRSTLADMVARMEGARLVKRVPSPEDARAKSVSLTAAGRRKLAAVQAAVQSADEALLASLPKSRRSSFLSALSVLAEVSDRDTLKTPEPEPKPPLKKVKTKKIKTSKKTAEKKKSGKKKKKAKA